MKRPLLCVTLFLAVLLLFSACQTAQEPPAEPADPEPEASVPAEPETAAPA